ncbi:FHA domain-containing protein [Plesiocystis pacifica]|nr:FHA domain-containing protein [Plesiocystis pacifica]
MLAPAAQAPAGAGYVAPPPAAAPPMAPAPAAVPPPAVPPQVAPHQAPPPHAAAPPPPSPIQNQPPPMEQQGYGQQLRFDPNTGQPIAPPQGQAQDPNKPAAKTMFFGALQQEAVTPRLVVIKGEGGDGVTYHLSGTTHVVGRTHGDIAFAEDVFLSPEHARFSVQNGRLFVQDLSNNNGVFVRIKRPMPLDHGDLFLLGEQLLEIDSAPLPEYAPNQDGTYFYGSPRPDGAFRVIQQLAGGGQGLVHSANGNTLSMGREGNDLDFPDDRFISGHHAKLDLTDNAMVLLTDTGSRNGTFIPHQGRSRAVPRRLPVRRSATLPRRDLVRLP